MCKKTLGRQIILISLITCLLLLAACQPASPSFPNLPGQEPGQTEQLEQKEVDAEIKEQAEPVTLEMAVPFGEAAAQALGLLFQARKTGEQLLVRETLTGHVLDLSLLDHLAGFLHLIVEQVPAGTGISPEQVARAEAANALPDIIYCSALASSPGLDRVQVLDELLFANDLLQPRFISAGAVDSLRQGGHLRAVPYLASTPVLAHNKSLLDKFQLTPPPASWTWAGWASWLAQLESQLAAQGASAGPERIKGLSDDADQIQQLLEKAIFPYQDLGQFLPFIAPSLSSTAGWAMWDGYQLDLDSPALQGSAIFLRSLAGFDPSHLDEEQELLFKSGAGEAILGQVVDSADQAALRGQQTSLMPAGPLQEKKQAEQQIRRLPARVRCLALARTSKHPQLAADLAAFIALDPDALLLQKRFNSYEGLFPLVKDDLVWEEYMSDQPLLSQIKDELDHLYFGGQQTQPGWDKMLDQAFLANAGEFLKAAGPEQQAILNRIKAQISQIHNEGG